MPGQHRAHLTTSPGTQAGLRADNRRWWQRLFRRRPVPAPRHARPIDEHATKQEDSQ
jgi:hypothetical protein